MKRLRRQRNWAISLKSFLAAMSLWASSSAAHPHVFVDGGVDFIFNDEQDVTSVAVTWRYDAFETLFLLSELGVVPAQGTMLDDNQRALVEDALGAFPNDFDGSAHLSVDGNPVELMWPYGLMAGMVEDRLEVRFLRDLKQPLSMEQADLRVKFYERTYFFAFSLTDTPSFIGGGDACSFRIEPFRQTDETADLAGVLAALGREEQPGIADVGEKFADELRVTCS